MSAPLAAALDARSRIWPEPPMDVGKLEPGWITAAMLFANEAALYEQLRYQSSFFTKVDPKSPAAFLVTEYSVMFALTSVPLLIGAGLVPDLSPSNVALQFYTHTSEHEGKPTEQRRARVRFLSGGFVTANEQDAAHQDAIAHLDHAGLSDAFRQAVEAHFTPLIATLNRITALPRGAMWRLVGDLLAARFLDVGRRHDCLDEAKATAMAVLKHPGSPLNNRQLHFVDVTLPDEQEPDKIRASWTFRSRGGCCRFYKIEGKGLCSTCVLHDPATRDEMLRKVMRRRLGQMAD